MSSKKTLYLVDGSNNLYRSYYAIRNLSTSTGMATNAIYGFTQMLRKLLHDRKPDAIAVAFDVKGKTFRHQQFEDYKKDRKPMPDDLVEQVPYIHEIIRAFGIPVIGLEGYEADDLIGSLAFKARHLGYEVVLATADKDFFQLVGPGISFYHTGRDEQYDEAGVRETFGLPPDKVVDVMAIWGDKIDNIPGVPGIGEKGAKELIGEFGSLDNLLANLDKVQKKGQRTKLEENREKALLSRDLARIRTDLEIDIDPEDLPVAPPDRAKLHELFAKFEFQSLMQEYMPDQRVAHEYRVLGSPEELRRYLEEPGSLAVHFEPLEASGTGSPARLALSRGRAEAAIVSLEDAEIRNIVRELLKSDRALIAHDMKTQLGILTGGGLPHPAKYDDTMIMSYVLNPGLYGHALDSVARVKLTRDCVERKDLAKKVDGLPLDEPSVVEFLGEKSDITFALREVLGKELAGEDALERIYATIEMPLVPILARMEQNGIRIDVDLLREMSSTMGGQIEELEKKIYEAAGEEFNINSPQQLGVILFEKLQYPAARKTQKTKSYSTGVEVLSELASHGFEVPRLILEHRELHKLKSTYVDALPSLVAGDGRVHTTFNQAVAATGRLSSSDPNLQNIPVRTEQGREIRKAFVAEEGHVLLSADYSQIELRVLAHMSEDPDLIDAFRRGVDIHRATAAKVFGAHEDLVTPDQRRAAKTINFGVLYGMSSFRLANELGISGKEAKEFIDAYFDRYPRIREVLDRTLKEARETGKVSTLFGRVRYIPEISNRSWAIRSNAERMATNAPMQGTAADLLKMAMIEVDRTLREKAPSTSMLLTVHDELVFEVPEGDAERVAKLVTTTMESVHPLAVPLSVDCHWGRTWYDAKA